MALAIRATVQAHSTNSTTTITIPASVQPGDFLILQASGAWTPTMPNGWDVIYSQVGSNVGAAVGVKVATALDAGVIVTVSWSIAQYGYLNLVAISGGGYGLRSEKHLWSSGAGPGTPAALNALADDLIIYLGTNRIGGGPSTLSRGTVDVATTDTSGVFSGTIGHELLSSDVTGLTCTFTSPSGGAGFQHSVLAVASSPVTVTSYVSRTSIAVLVNDASQNRIVSNQSIAVLMSDAVVNRVTSRSSIGVLVKTKSRYRGWGPER
jgi:hypothetical protein